MDRAITRACIVTPPGEGGIGIIALSGAGAADVLDKVFVGTKRPARSIPHGAIAHGTVRRNGQTIDEVIVARTAPEHGATDEPYFEVNCHGGVVAVRTVLECLEEAGAQVVRWQEVSAQTPEGAGPLSEPAIRTRARAELPHAPTRLGALMLLHQLNGALAAELTQIGRSLSDGDGSAALARLDDLIRTAPLGLALLHPPTVALLGPANVGKSTLLNALLEEERAIVHHEPGTTRDVVAETVSLHGVPFELMDCAGIRDARDGVEQHAVRRAADLAGVCDVALLVFDVRQGPRGSLESLPPLRQGARAVLVGNKTDLLDGPPAPGPVPPSFSDCPLICLSAREQTNLDGLESVLLQPYRDVIEPCRNGRATIFCEEALGALRAVRDHLRAGRTKEGLEALRAARREMPRSDVEQAGCRAAPIAPDRS